MKVNDWALSDVSNGNGTMEGRLQHKKHSPNISHGFKERWFKLKHNILYYFNLNDLGQVLDCKPAGALVLENCTAACELSCEAPFAFSVIFHDDVDRRHVFAAMSEEKVLLWVAALKQASYEAWRARLLILQMQITSITGQDPLLLYHRSEGSRLPLPPPPCRSADVPSRLKLPKKTSFQSFVGSALLDQSVSSPLPPHHGLIFYDDHFGNGLEAIGSPPLTAVVPGQQPPTGGPQLVPTRVAPPPPPTRPPRTARQPTANLIDL